MVLSLLNKRTGKRFPLDAPTTLVGRDPKLRFCLNDVGVSRRHAVLLLTEEGVIVNDLGSRNGVFVNGRMIGSNGATRIGRGDRITIGGTTFLLEEAETQEIDLDALEELREERETDDMTAATEPPADELPDLLPDSDTGALDAVLDDLASCFDDGLEPITPGVLDPGDSAELILDPDAE